MTRQDNAHSKAASVLTCYMHAVSKACNARLRTHQQSCINQLTASLSSNKGLYRIDILVVQHMRTNELGVARNIRCLVLMSTWNTTSSAWVELLA